MASTPQGDALLVALGAIPGAWLRFRIVEHLSPMLLRRHWGTLVVNLAGSFSLGLLVSLVGATADRHGQSLLLLLATGFCGSLSTFSTWMVELWQQLRTGQWRGALLLGGASLGLGLLAVSLGLWLGRIALGEAG